nr:hypothetical protein [Tanacetum cinerariifolium]
MEDTMLEWIEVFRQKEFYCMHNNVDDLIESALNSKLLSINLESQCLDKKKQKVKNVIEQLSKCGTRIAKSLQNFRVKKSSFSLNNKSQISQVHAITPILPTEEPEYSLSMGYEHLSIFLETESDEVKESSAKNLLPIPIEYEVTSNDESACNVPNKDEFSSVFTSFSNPLFDDNDDFTSSDDESLSNEDVPMEDFKVYSNPLFNSNTIIKTLPTSPIPLEDSDSQREEIDIFTGTDELLPLSIESDDYDSEGDINVLEVLLVDDSIFLPENASFYFDHHDNLSFLRPPPEPLDVVFSLIRSPK